MTKIGVTSLVVVHLLASLWHGGAHTQLGVELPPWKTGFVFVVILIAPIVAAVLTWTRYFPTGLRLFTISMLGALLFGAYHHYVMVSPDNIGHLPAGSPESHGRFIASAAVIAVLELAGALYGAYCLGSQHSRSQARP